jgi:hypothetical protein
VDSLDGFLRRGAAQQLPQLSPGAHWVPHDAGHVTPLPPAQPPVQVASHAQLSLQSIPLLQSAPLQVAAHAPVPHWIPAPHDAFIVQLAVQSPPPLQSMPLAHAPEDEHATSQRSAVHTSGELQELLALHVIAHSVPSHATPLVQVFDAVHWISHLSAAHTIGPPLQSPLWLHSSRQSTPVTGHAQTEPQLISQ